MLDRHIVPILRPLLQRAATTLDWLGARADQVTLAGFGVGLCSVALLAGGWYLPALACLLLNRLADGLDGELARLQGTTEAGALLDITLDFLFYGLFPLGFALADPAANALPAAILVVSFIGTGSSFLAFSVFAAKYRLKHPDFPWKGLYYLNGLMEGSETVLFFILMCLLPDWFGQIAMVFAALCLLTTVSRIAGSYLTLRELESGAGS